MPWIWAGTLTIQDVAQHLGADWDTIKDIQKRYLQRRFGNPKLRKLKQIAIDEIAVGNGHHYVTVVLNLLSGTVVFVGKGKGADALEPFWRRLRRAPVPNPSATGCSHRGPHRKRTATLASQSKRFMQPCRKDTNQLSGGPARPTEQSSWMGALTPHTPPRHEGFLASLICRDRAPGPAALAGPWVAVMGQL